VRIVLGDQFERVREDEIGERARVCTPGMRLVRLLLAFAV
jgi:hypothetical protein